VPAHRGGLVAAALTIVRAYLAAGEPLKGKLPNFARFEDWSRLVREPLVWLGMADPCLTRKAIEERDPVRERLGQLLDAWHGMFGPKPTTVAKAIAQATLADWNETAATKAVREALKLALAEVAGDRTGAINPKVLGGVIAAHERRIEGGLRFEKHPVLLHKVVQWRAIATQDHGGFGGLGGSPDPNAGKCQSANPDNSPGQGRTTPRNPPNPHPSTEAIQLQDDVS
jgi:hypothetical protein